MNNSFSCDWKSPEPPLPGDGNRSAVYKFLPSYTGASYTGAGYAGAGYRWDGIKTEAYKEEKGHFANIIRKVITGDKKESCLFEVRYFEISESGFSSFDQHQHEHVVICVRGQGKVLLGSNTHHLSYLDIVYISPHTPHQFIHEGRKEPFGFFCIVNRERDKPQQVGT